MMPRLRDLATAAALTLGALTLGALTPLPAQGLPAGNPASLGFSPARLARIGTVMQHYVDSGQVAGVVVLVARHGQVAYFHAFGSADREAGRRMTSDALFRIASQTKAITSVAAMMLVEEGKLSLHDPVSRWIPSFAHTTVAELADSGRTPVAAKRPITIHDLLTHTSGISYGVDERVAERYRAAGLGPAAGWGWYTADKDEPICTTMNRLGTLPFVAQPGTAFVYGYSLDVLGCVIERVSGMPLDQYFRTKLFQPLRMNSTWFFPPAAAASRLAAVYASTDSGLARAPDGPKGQGDYLAGPRRSFAGGAGLVSTASDYARFLQMMLNGGSLDGVRVLSPATVALMTADHVDSLLRDKANGFGLGFEVLLAPGLAATYGSAGSFSWGGAYATSYWADPKEGIVGVYMMQQLPNRADLGSKFHTLVYQAITGPGSAVAGP